MTTKRAPIESDGPPLLPAVVRMLLSGWSACGHNLTPAESSIAFDFFQSHVCGAAETWQRYEGYLRAEAKRLGIEPMHGEHPPWRYFGEHCCELVAREPHVYARRGGE
jgi:hypothetical protein